MLKDQVVLRISCRPQYPGPTYVYIIYVYNSTLITFVENPFLIQETSLSLTGKIADTASVWQMTVWLNYNKLKTQRNTQVKSNTDVMQSKYTRHAPLTKQYSIWDKGVMTVN